MWHNYGCSCSLWVLKVRSIGFDYRMLSPVLIASAYAVLSITPAHADKAAPSQALPSGRLDLLQVSLEGKLPAARTEVALANQALALCNEEKYGEAIGIYTKLLIMHPDCSAHMLGKALAYRDSGAVNVAVRQLESLIKNNESKGMFYPKPYVAMFETYRKAREYAKCEQMCSVTLKKFYLVPGVIEAVINQNTALRSSKLEAEIAAARKLRAAKAKMSTPTMESITPPSPVRLSPSEAYELIVETSSIPRFKCTIARDRLVGDSGIVKNYIGAPNYDRVLVVNEESNNFVDMSLDDWLANHVGRRSSRFDFGTINRNGQVTKFGHKCTVYKANLVQSSSNVALTLTDDVSVTPELARVINKVCGVPESRSVPVYAEMTNDDVRARLMTVLSMKKVKITPASMRPVAGLQRVKNIGELIYAMDGPLNSKDVNDVLKTKVK